MDENSLKKYLTEDFPQALDFYDSRAGKSKRWYRFLSIYLIVVAALLTPIVALTAENNWWRIVSTFMSATIVIATGLLSHLKAHENWLSYRGSWDALKRERRMYDTGVDVYATATDKNALFVERVEAVLSREAEGFYSRHAKGEEQAKKPTGDTNGERNLQ